MSVKMITALVAAGLVAFCMAFFRTGSPDISGLDRPKVNLATYAAPKEESSSKTSAKPTTSRFKRSQADNKKTTPKNRNIQRKDNNNRKAMSRSTGLQNRRPGGSNKVRGLKHGGARREKNRREEELKRRRALEEFDEDIPPSAALGLPSPDLETDEEIEEEMVPNGEDAGLMLEPQGIVE